MYANTLTTALINFQTFVHVVVETTAKNKNSMASQSTCKCTIFISQAHFASHSPSRKPSLFVNPNEDFYENFLHVLTCEKYYAKYRRGVASSRWKGNEDRFKVNTRSVLYNRNDYKRDFVIFFRARIVETWNMTYIAGSPVMVFVYMCNSSCLMKILPCDAVFFDVRFFPGRVLTILRHRWGYVW